MLCNVMYCVCAVCFLERERERRERREKEVGRRKKEAEGGAEGQPEINASIAFANRGFVRRASVGISPYL